MRAAGWIAMLVMLPGWAQTVTVAPSPAGGIELIGSQSPGFRADVEAIVGAAAMPLMEPWLPFTAVLKNNSGQTLAGYEIRWSAGNANMSIGQLSTTDPSGLKPGSMVVALPSTLLMGPPGPQTQAGLAQSQSKWLPDFQAAPAVTISVDSAIFASGQFVGPDVGRNFDKDTAQFSAWRGVDLEVQSQLAAGASFDGIASVLSQMTNQPVEGRRAARDWNAQVRATEARHLLKLYRQSGGQALADRIQQQLQLPVISIHR